jgi:hypothetical protein
MPFTERITGGGEYGRCCRVANDVGTRGTLDRADCRGWEDESSRLTTTPTVATRRSMTAVSPSLSQGERIRNPPVLDFDLPPP